ncbi:MAG: flagellar basal body P-ring formation protein FlgA [Methylophaga sp.]|nr:flagellar basal body P-ring formation protein FlgA [Methylophaga sp.]
MWKYTISLILGLLVMNVQAADLHALADIEQAAYEYALKQAQTHHDNPQVVMESLDRRLRLKACGSELEVFTKNARAEIGHQTIGVKCSLPSTWTVYVPVKVKVFKTVMVVNSSLPANHIITAGDIKSQTRDIGTLRQGYLVDENQLIGQQLKYSMSMGTVINPNSIRPQKIVRRGELILLVVSVGKMEVRMNGTALADAQLGQRVKVKNSSSKRVVEGIVQAPGIVKVAM